MDTGDRRARHPMAADTATRRGPASRRATAPRRRIAVRVHLMDLVLRIEADRPPTAHLPIEVDRLLMEEAHPRIVHRLRLLRPTMVAVDRIAVVVDIVAEAAGAADTTVAVEEAALIAEAEVVVDTPRLAEAMVDTGKED
jgi:hypothetical protein